MAKVYQVLRDFTDASGNSWKEGERFRFSEEEWRANLDRLDADEMKGHIVLLGLSFG